MKIELKIELCLKRVTIISKLNQSGGMREDELAGVVENIMSESALKHNLQRMQNRGMVKKSNETFYVEQKGYSWAKKVLKIIEQGITDLREDLGEYEG